MKETPLRLKMIDTLIMLSLGLFFLQATYGVLMCRDPFNSFIAGTFCSMGIFGLTMSLRVQLGSHDVSAAEVATFDGQELGKEQFESAEARKIFEYIVGCLCLFFACFTLMG